MTSLGICIPTYKRPEFLRRCVLSAINSAEGRPIKIYIADDSISNCNDDVVMNLQSKYPFIEHHINQKNLGIDENIQNVVDLCECDYAWLIGEDDEFVPGAVSTMFDFLQERNDPFIFSAYQYVTESHSEVLGVVSAAAADCDLLTDLFVEHHLWSIGFIGAVVVNRGAWGRTKADLYIGTYFTHVGRILEMLSTTPKVPVRHCVAVSNRAQGDDTFTWKKDSFGVFLGFERMCDIAAKQNKNLSNNLARAAKRYREKFAYFSIKTTFRLRSEGAFDLRQYKVHIASLSSIELWRKIWLLCLAITPPIFLKPFARFYLNWIKHRPV